MPNGTIADGVRAMKEGAFDYLIEGDADDQAIVVVDRIRRKSPPSAPGD